MNLSTHIRYTKLPTVFGLKSTFVWQLNWPYRLDCWWIRIVFQSFIWNLIEKSNFPGKIKSLNRWQNKRRSNIWTDHKIRFYWKPLILLRTFYNSCPNSIARDIGVRFILVLSHKGLHTWADLIDRTFCLFQQIRFERACSSYN